MLGMMQDMEIEALLKDQLVGHLGCYANQTILVVPISYAYDGTFVYGHSAKGLKIQLMRKNPSVCFQVDHLKDMANWQTVIAWGTFEELTVREERHTALQILLDRILPLDSSETTHLYPQWPFPSENIDDIKGIVFRIRLNKKTGRFESNNCSPPLPG